MIVYQKSYDLALEIFEITKTFPKEERYSLVDQIRRSSRSVPANIAEAWVKRKYPKSFISKLLDSLAEEAETETKSCIRSVTLCLISHNWRIFRS